MQYDYLNSSIAETQNQMMDKVFIKTEMDCKAEANMETIRSCLGVMVDET